MAMGLSASDSYADGDWGDFVVDLGLQAASLGLVRFAGADELLPVVLNANVASLDIILNTGELFCWDGY